MGSLCVAGLLLSNLAGHRAGIGHRGETKMLTLEKFVKKAFVRSLLRCDFACPHIDKKGRSCGLSSRCVITPCGFHCCNVLRDVWFSS